MICSPPEGYLGYGIRYEVGAVIPTVNTMKPTIVHNTPMPIGHADYSNNNQTSSLLDADHDATSGSSHDCPRIELGTAEARIGTELTRRMS